MSYKIFRLHKGSNTHDDWKTTNEIGTNDINTILDPEGGTAEKEITSIPSPFARIHLFEQAFEYVCNMAHDDISQLDKNTVYHKLVSDSLDVGEVFFNYDQFSKVNQMRVVRWNKKTEIQSLLDSSYEGHVLLGQTLDLFLKQDGRASNFGIMQNLHFLYVDHTLIGGTSPSTLFFSTANSLRDLDLRREDDILFDQEFNPLYNRGKSFQRYLYGLFTANKDLKSKMPLVWNYLSKCLDKLKSYNRDLFNELKEMEREYTLKDFYEEFEKPENTDTIDIFPTDSGSIEHLRERSGIIGEKSDYFIKSSKYQGEHKPLVIQNKDQRNLTYFGSKKWDPKTEVPYFDPSPLNERLLPILKVNYPYLTVSDFLEPTLIKLPYAIDRTRFFDGNPIGFEMGNKAIDNPPEDSYLIPVKRKYFDFFGLDDLKAKTPDNRPIISMTKVDSSSVKVQLRIPVGERNDYVVFERLYTEGVSPNEEKNEGGIMNLKFSLGFLPYIAENALVEQRVGLIDADVAFGSNRNSQYSLSFLHLTNTGYETIAPEQEAVRSDMAKGHSHRATSKYFILAQDYEVVEVGKTDGIKGSSSQNFSPLLLVAKNLLLPSTSGQPTPTSNMPIVKGGVRPIQGPSTLGIPLLNWSPCLIPIGELPCHSWKAC